jgi:hypothetical protein
MGNDFMATLLQPIELSVQYANFKTSSRLLHRMYVGDERKLCRMIFNPMPQFIPAFFGNPNHPLTIQARLAINNALVIKTTDTLFEEWGLNSHEIDQLQMDDPRIAALRQRLTREIDSIPFVQQLRAGHIQ